MTRPYIVRQGDYLAKVAMETGFGVDEIWSLPKNDALREHGRTPDLLLPGDVLHLPRGAPRAQEVTLQGTNPFRAQVARAKLRLVFKDGPRPRAHKKYRVRDLGVPKEGETDGDGTLTLDVPVNVGMVRVIFEDPFAMYRVWIGHIDPATEPSGIAARLRQLGYLPAEVVPGATDEGATIDALRRFQRDQGLDVTGDADEATLAALRKVFGS